MIVAIYKDSGPTSGCGQDVILTAPREEAHIFPTYEDFRRADYALLKSSERKEARYIKWYEATDAIPRATVAAALPESWYADSPLEFRVQKMVEQWQKLHKREKEVAAALRELRDGYTRRADGEGASIEWRAATDLARQELDATIAALGLEDLPPEAFQGRKEKQWITR